MKSILFIILFLPGFTEAGSKPPIVPKEIRNISYNVYRQACKGIKCEQIPIKSGRVTVALAPENEEHWWGVTTENFKKGNAEYKLIIHLSKEGKRKYQLEGSLAKTQEGHKPLFSSAAVATDDYVAGIKLILKPSEGAGPQTRVSLILE